VTTVHERLVGDLAATIALGYEVEADDPNFEFRAPREDEVRWLAAWLVSEGLTRSSRWPND
jgi:hypothetical protein